MLNKIKNLFVLYFKGRNVGVDALLDNGAPRILVTFLVLATSTKYVVEKMQIRFMKFVRVTRIIFGLSVK